MGVVRYANSCYTGDLKDRKLMIGYYFFLGGVIVILCSKRQRTVSTSISEAEYVAVSQRVKEGIWI